MTSTPRPNRRERASRPITRDEVVALVLAAVLGALWGAAWQRTAALTDIASMAPALLIVIGPALLIVFLGLRIATGRFEMRVTGYGAIVAVAAALVANLLTPGLSSSVSVPGHLTGTLDGVAVDDSAAQCVWGPGRTQVVTVTDDRQRALTENVPAGQLTIDLPSGAVYVNPAALGLASPTVPLRMGTGDAGQGDRSSGTITLDPTLGSLVAGQLSWTCGAAPAN